MRDGWRRVMLAIDRLLNFNFITHTRARECFGFADERGML